jgi:hypothetical protein
MHHGNVNGFSSLYPGDFARVCQLDGAQAGGSGARSTGGEQQGGKNQAEQNTHGDSPSCSTLRELENTEVYRMLCRWVLEMYLVIRIVV